MDRDPIDWAEINQPDEEPMANATAKQLKIQAREIIREASRQGATWKRGSRNWCVLGVLSRYVSGDRKFEWVKKNQYLSHDQIAEFFNVATSDIFSLECGFEGWLSDGCNMKMYRIGKNVARLAGLEDKS
jgi:hypothetical protein